MAYGIEVGTTNGMMNLVDIGAMRLVHKSNRTAKNASTTLGVALVTDAIPFARVNDGLDPPFITINEAAGTVSWGVQYGSTTETTSGDWTLCLYKVV